MAGHPQNSARGLFAKNRVDLGTSEITFSADNLSFENGIVISGISTALITADSTGRIVLPAGAKISNAAGGVITANSTTAIFAGGVKVSNAAGGQITANSTTATFAGGVKVSNAAGGALTADASNLNLPGGVKVSNALVLTANSSALISGASALPGNLSTGILQIASNSTGAWAAVRTTGTTWKYLNVTTALPT